jgi:hypothetical protein
LIFRALKNLFANTFFLSGFFVVMICFPAAAQQVGKEKYTPKSVTAEKEHQLTVQFGQNQLFNQSFRTVWGGRGFEAVETFYVPHFEVTYARWFHERNYVGLVFRTGQVHYNVQIANDTLWPIYNPDVTGPVAEVAFKAWHLNYLGFFWKYDFIDEYPLIKGRKRDLIFHSSFMVEGGVNLMSERYSKQGTYAGPDANGVERTWGFYDHRTIRTTQIRYGFRSRSSFTLDRFALLFDVGVNQGFRDFHFFQIESVRNTNTQPYFDLRNSLSYFFWNVGLGYWF